MGEIRYVVSVHDTRMCLHTWVVSSKVCKNWGFCVWSWSWVYRCVIFYIWDLLKWTFGHEHSASKIKPDNGGDLSMGVIWMVVFPHMHTRICTHTGMHTHTTLMCLCVCVCVCVCVIKCFFTYISAISQDKSGLYALPISPVYRSTSYSVSEMGSYQGGLHSSGLSPMLFPEIVYFDHSENDTLLRQ